MKCRSLNLTRILSDQLKGPQAGDELVKQSLLYLEHQAEREEILRHKWYQSEKKGHDIGFDLAQVDWRIKHRSQWRKERSQEHEPLTFEI
jgi:hypothetical protein